MTKKVVAGIVVLFITLSCSVALGKLNRELPVVWPEAVTFSKQEMTRLDITDPSYENRLKNIRSTSGLGPFASWKQVINTKLND